MGIKQTHKWNIESEIIVHVRCPHCGKHIQLDYIYEPNIGDSDTCYLCGKVFVLGER